MWEKKVDHIKQNRCLQKIEKQLTKKYIYKNNIYIVKIRLIKYFYTTGLRKNAYNILWYNCRDTLFCNDVMRFLISIFVQN